MTHEGGLVHSERVRQHDRAVQGAAGYGSVLIRTGGVLLSWLYLTLPTWGWLFQSIREISLFNQTLLLFGALLLLAQAVRHRHRFQWSAAPVLRTGPLTVLAIGAIGTVGARWLLTLDQLPIVFGLFGTYGLLGFFLPPETWRRGITISAAIALIVPFGVQFSSGIGFPARIVTAHLVEYLLKFAHIAALSSEDIIVLDTGIARVDLPCSGLRSLWTGTLFLLAATWLEGRQLGWRWLGVFLLNLGTLAIANVARVLAIVMVAHVWQQPTLAEILHVPLGVLSFVISCGIGWAMLRWVPRGSARQRNREPSGTAAELSAMSFQGRGFRYAPFLLAIGILALTLIPQPSAVSRSLPDLAHLRWSKLTHVQPIALNSTEQEFFADHPGVVAQKQRFQFEGLTGSILFVASPTLQAHHAPELCLIGSGYRLEQIVPQQAATGLFTRWLLLNQGTQTAVYWFQSPRQTTGDFLVRFWQEASRQDASWTLVSILFDRAYPSDDPDVQAFLLEVQRSLAQSLQGK